MSFAEQLRRDSFTLISEVDPPKGVLLDTFMERVSSLKGRVDALAVTDCEHAVMRMSPLAPARNLIEAGGDPVIVMNGRDRNRISLQAELLSAWALGIRNVVVKEGIDPDWGDQPLVRSSGDLSLETMLQCLSALNLGKDLGGEEIEGKTAFTFGVGFDLSDDININRKRADDILRYAEYGVRFIVLGPTYDKNILDLFLPKAEEAGIKVFSTLMLLKSVGMIRYLNGLAGVPSVPNEYLKDMLDAKIKAEAGLSIAADFYRDIQDVCDGAVLHSLGWGARLPQFLDRIGR